MAARKWHILFCRNRTSRTKGKTKRATFPNAFLRNIQQRNISLKHLSHLNSNIMYNGYSLNELILMGATVPFLLCAIIALFNFDWLNDAVISFYKWIDKKYESTSSWFWKPFFGILKFPTFIASPVSHGGWKSGLSVGFGTFSFAILLGALYIAAWVAAIIVGIIVVLYILAAVLGGSK